MEHCHHRPRYRKVEFLRPLRGGLRQTREDGVSLTAQKSSRAVIISTLTNHIAGGRPRTRV